MSFYQIIKNGQVIRIEDKRDAAVGGFYDPAEFWYANGAVMCWCPEIGKIKNPTTAKAFNEHIMRMISDGMTITIKHQNDFVREYR